MQVNNIIVPDAQAIADTLAPIVTSLQEAQVAAQPVDTPPLDAPIAQ